MMRAVRVVTAPRYAPLCSLAIPVSSHSRPQPQTAGPGLGRQGVLCLDRRLHGVFGILERHSEPVAVSGKDPAPVPRERLTQDLGVACQHPFDLAGMLFPQRGRALDVRQQESQLSSRRLPHLPRRAPIGAATESTYEGVHALTRGQLAADGQLAVEHIVGDTSPGSDDAVAPCCGTGCEPGAPAERGDHRGHSRSSPTATVPARCVRARAGLTRHGDPRPARAVIIWRGDTSWRASSQARSSWTSGTRCRTGSRSWHRRRRRARPTCCSWSGTTSATATMDCFGGPVADAR